MYFLLAASFTDKLLKQFETNGFVFLSGFIFAFFIFFAVLDIPDKINSILNNQELMLRLLDRGSNAKN